MADRPISTAEQIDLETIRLGRRAINFIKDVYGSLESLADGVRLREVHQRNPMVGGNYTVGGVRDALEFGRFRDDHSKLTGTKTALEIASVLLIEGLATFEDCFPDGGTEYELSGRTYFNDLMKAKGWEGPFMPGRMKPRTPKAATRAEKLEARRTRLLAELAKIERELSQT